MEGCNRCLFRCLGKSAALAAPGAGGHDFWEAAGWIIWKSTGGAHLRPAVLPKALR